MHYSSSSTMAAIHAVPGEVMGIRESRRAGVPNDWAIAAVAVSIAVLVAAGMTSIAILG
jgi:hypothetical protein